MKTLVSVKIDTDIKNKAKKVAQELGLSLSTLVNAQLRDLVRTRSVSFSAAPRMTPYLEEVTRQAEEDYHKGINVSRPLKTVGEISDYLDSL